MNKKLTSTMNHSSTMNHYSTMNHSSVLTSLFPSLFYYVSNDLLSLSETSNTIYEAIKEKS